MQQVLYYGGPILTLEQPLYAEALLQQGGIIRAVGPLEKLKAMAPDAKRVNLAGRALLPAFLDAHSHFSGYANALLQVRLEGAQSYEDIRRGIEQFIRENAIPAGQWVMARGYDHNALQEKRPPHKSLLDEAAPHNPLVLQHASGHTGVFNTLALQELGVRPDTPAPAGGAIEVKDGELTGYMEENAFIEYLQRAPMPTPETLMQAFQKAQQAYASYGITTVQEGMMTDVMAPLYRALCDTQALYLDVVGYADLRGCERLLHEFAAHVDTYKAHFKLGGYKTFLDGSPQARTAWMRAPYANAPDGYAGYGTLSDEELLARCRRALREGRQLLAHCNGDAAAGQYIRVFNRAMGELDDAPDIRPVMIHAQLVGQDQLPRMKELGMIPSFFVAHVYHWGDVHLENFGPQRAANISPAAAAGALGIPYTFHQDAPVIEPNMLETIWCAVNRVTKQGVSLGPQQRVSALDAVRAVTIHAAHQYFEEHQKGSLAAGKHADFVILSADPTAVPPMQIRNIEVLATIKDGQCIFEKEMPEA